MKSSLQTVQFAENRMKVRALYTFHMFYMFIYFVFVLRFSLYIHIIIKNAYIIKNELLIYQFSAFTSFHEVKLKLEMLYSKCN